MFKQSPSEIQKGLKCSIEKNRERIANELAFKLTLKGRIWGRQRREKQSFQVVGSTSVTLNCVCGTMGSTWDNGNRFLRELESVSSLQS